VDAVIFMVNCKNFVFDIKLFLCKKAAPNGTAFLLGFNGNLIFS